MNIESSLQSLLVSAVSVVPIPDCNSEIGRFSGKPPFEWPVCSGCGSYESFILELNFSKFSQVPYDKNLSIFYCWNCMPCSSDELGVTLWDQDQNDNRDLPDSTIEFDLDYEIIPSGMKFEEIQVLPSPESLFVHQRELCEELRFESPDDPWTTYRDFLHRNSINQFHQTCITQHPRWIEGYVELICECGKLMHPFFQVGSHSDINLIWEADGIMYLFACIEPNCDAMPKMVIQGF